MSNLNDAPESIDDIAIDIDAIKREWFKNGAVWAGESQVRAEGQAVLEVGV